MGAGAGGEGGMSGEGLRSTDILVHYLINSVIPANAGIQR